MRHTLLAASLAAFSLPTLAQDAPRVLFCSGPCFAVDAAGTRTPVTKGSPIAPGQRLETGPGAYLQVKADRVGLGLGENTRLRFDRGTLILDEGRMRAVTGIGTGVVRPPQIRTPDGDLALGSGDIEIKKTAAPGTLVKVNAGDAVLRSGAGEFKLPTEGVQSLQGGRFVLAPPTRGQELVVAPPRRDLPGTPAPRTPLATPVPLGPIALGPRLSIPLPPPPPAPLPPLMQTKMNESLKDPTTGQIATPITFIRQEVLAPPPAGTIRTFTPITTAPPTTPITTFRPRTGTTFVIR